MIYNFFIIDKINPMKIKCFSQGQNVPSSRFRLENYISPIKKRGMDLEILYPYQSSYPPESFYKKLTWFLNEILHRLRQIKNLNKNDKLIVQRELISTIPTLEVFLKSPYIFDVDDAIFLHKKGIAANLIAKNAAHVVCGNNYLANYFKNYNKNISVIPTGINSKIFKPLRYNRRKKLICWSGTSGNFNYLYKIENEIKKVLDKETEWKLRIISNKKPNFHLIDKKKIDFLFWSPKNESKSIAQCSIGIMPIPDTNWAKGKCSFKMLQYMSCGLPVIVSSVGMNNEVLKLGNLGFGIKSNSEWSIKLFQLIQDSDLRRKLGKQGRIVALKEFDIEILSNRLADVIEKVYN